MTNCDNMFIKALNFKAKNVKNTNLSIPINFLLSMVYLCLYILILLDIIVYFHICAIDRIE